MRVFWFHIYAGSENSTCWPIEFKD